MSPSQTPLHERALAQGVSLGTLDAPMFAPATGYISFFTLALYVGGLMLTPAPVTAPDAASQELLAAYQQLAPHERLDSERAIEISKHETTNSDDL